MKAFSLGEVSGTGSNGGLKLLFFCVSLFAFLGLAAFPQLHSDSSVDCPLTVTAGDAVWCTVRLYAHDTHLPVGTDADSCRVLLSICPESVGDAHWMQNGTLDAPGVYKFHFTPTASGANKVSVTVGNNTLTSGSTSIFVGNAAVNPQHASTSCSVDADGQTVCTVQHKDKYQNVVRECETTFDGAGLPAHSQCTVL